jgi:hypothetical protein
MCHFHDGVDKMIFLIYAYILMNNKTIVQPLWSGILVIIIDLILIGVFVDGIFDEGLSFRVLVFGLFIFFWAFLTIHSFTTYQFKFYDILVKYPFGIIKKYDIEDIIGYTFDWGGESAGLFFKIYFENKTLYITLSGCKSENIALDFFNDNYKKIEDKNIEKIMNDVMEIKINKRNALRFSKEKFELIKNTRINVYYYAKNINKIELKKNRIGKGFEKRTLIIQTYDGEKLKLNDDKCKGGIGLFEYLVENIKCGNGT